VMLFLGAGYPFEQLGSLAQLLDTAPLRVRFHLGEQVAEQLWTFDPPAGEPWASQIGQIGSGRNPPSLPVGRPSPNRRLPTTWADTTTAHGRLMLTVLGGLAEFERELIRARTGEGRSRAKARGQHMGATPETHGGAEGRGPTATGGGCYACRTRADRRVNFFRQGDRRSPHAPGIAKFRQLDRRPPHRADAVNSDLQAVDVDFDGGEREQLFRARRRYREHGD
jgi:hypothetical protein